MGWVSAFLLLLVGNMVSYYANTEEILNVICIGNHDSTGICKSEDKGSGSEASLDCIISSPGLVTCRKPTTSQTYDCILTSNISKYQNQFSCQSVRKISEDDVQFNSNSQRKESLSDIQINHSSSLRDQLGGDGYESKVNIPKIFMPTLGFSESELKMESDPSKDSNVFQDAF
mgnify:CR=1 FL=1